MYLPWEQDCALKASAIRLQVRGGRYCYNKVKTEKDSENVGVIDAAHVPETFK
jgi:hypothetical protein